MSTDIDESSTLKLLGQLVGAWTTDASHPAMPGVAVHGSVVAEWLEGERFLIMRSHTEHPAFPDAISIIGFLDRDRVDDSSTPAPSAADERRLRMHYFDSRGVFRVFEVSIDDKEWRGWRDAPGFSQRFTGIFADGGDTIAGTWQLSRDDVRWENDLAITYRRQK